MMFKEISLQNFLSFGPDGITITFQPLNVLLGANGTGKTNLVEALALLSACPRQGALSAHITSGDGISEWIHKGSKEPRRSMKIEAVVEQAGPKRLPALRHQIEIAEVGVRAEVVDERIENAEALPGKSKPFFYFGHESGVPMIRDHKLKRGLERETVRPDDSILAQRKDPDRYPVLWTLAEQYEKIRLVREWTFGPQAPCRYPCRTDAPVDFPRANGENIAIVLNNITRSPSTKKKIDELLQTLSPGFETFNTTVLGGLVQLFLVEREDRIISAKRLSDGTLRFLALLSILLHPAPPPVVVVEEPEMGLHPDLLPTVARLLVEASQRMQLFVTTHSDILVDALTDHHESVLFCDKTDGSTIIRHAEPEIIEAWCGKKAKEPKGLGQAWLAGAFGGKRW